MSAHADPTVAAAGIEQLEELVECLCARCDDITRRRKIAKQRTPPPSAEWLATFEAEREDLPATIGELSRQCEEIRAAL